MSAPISIRGRIVVFDYGEVISQAQPEADKAELLRLAGVEPASFWRAYARHRDGLDAGSLSVREYWRRVASDVGTTWDDILVTRLWAVDLRSWLSVSGEVVAILHDLSAGGTRLGLLSNAGRDFSAFFRNGALARLFEEIVVSGELGMVKPDARIFRHTAARLGVPPEQMVFIDNKPENVAGAQRLGITGHVFTGAPELRRFLTALTA